MTIELESGRRYAAKVHLGFFKRFASNVQIMAKLVDAGFVDVTVNGDGADRTATGKWSRATQTVELPSEISDVEVLT